MNHKCQEYEIIFDEKTGVLRALRNGEEWRDLVGDGMVLAMLQEIDDLKKRARLAGELMNSIEDFAGSEAVEVCEEVAEILNRSTK